MLVRPPGAAGPGQPRLLGELTFRGITATGCHPPVIGQATFDEAQRILAARGKDHAKRAASSSDYLLTGLMRCPACGNAMIGTREHGRSQVYRYYTCFTRVRYDTNRCAASRLDADAVEDAVIAALASFYRDQHALIADAIAVAQADHAAGDDRRRDEFAAAERELARAGAAIDRYLAAFENGTLDPEDLAGRLAQLKARSRRLRARRDELASELTSAPAPPPPATLRQVADHIDEIICAGSHNQRKALIEALIAQIKITGPGRIMPVFRIPQPRTDPPSEHRVRALTNLVGPVGLEPTLAGS